MSFGRTAPSRSPSRNAPSPAGRRPLLARAEVVDVAEDDVAHRRPVRDGEREREERDAPLRVHGAVDRVDHDDPAARRCRTCASRAPPRRGRSSRPLASSRATTASSAAWSIAVVSSPPSPRRSTGSRSARVGSRSSTCSMSRDACAAELEPGGHGRRPGGRGSPESGFGKKYVLFERHPPAAPRDREDVLDARLAEEVRDIGLARVDRGDGLVRARRVADPFEAVAVDELDVELALAAPHELARPRRYGDRDRRGRAARSARRASASSTLATCLALALRRAGPGAPRRRDASGTRASPGSAVETKSAMTRVPPGSSAPNSTAVS